MEWLVGWFVVGSVGLSVSVCVWYMFCVDPPERWLDVLAGFYILYMYTYIYMQQAAAEERHKALQLLAQVHATVEDALVACGGGGR